MQDELGGKIMTKFTATWPKSYSYLDDHDDDNICRKDKETKSLKPKSYKICIYEVHNVYVKHIMYILKKLTRLH